MKSEKKIAELHSGKKSVLIITCCTIVSSSIMTSKEFNNKHFKILSLNCTAFTQMPGNSSTELESVNMESPLGWRKGADKII